MSLSAGTSSGLEQIPRYVLLRAIAFLTCACAAVRMGYSVKGYLLHYQGRFRLKPTILDEDWQHVVARVEVSKLLKVTFSTDPDYPFTARFGVSIEVPRGRTMTVAATWDYDVDFLALKAAAGVRTGDEQELRRLLRAAASAAKSMLAERRRNPFCVSIYREKKTDELNIYVICLDLAELEHVLEPLLSRALQTAKILFAYRTYGRASRSSVHHVFEKARRAGLVVEQVGKGVYLCEPASRCLDMLGELDKLDVAYTYRLVVEQPLGSSRPSELLEIDVPRAAVEQDLVLPVEHETLSRYVSCAREVLIVLSFSRCGRSRHAARKCAERVRARHSSKLTQVADGVYSCREGQVCLDIAEQLRSCGADVRVFLSVDVEKLRQVRKARETQPPARVASLAYVTMAMLTQRIMAEAARQGLQVSLRPATSLQRLQEVLSDFLKSSRQSLRAGGGRAGHRGTLQDVGSVTTVQWHGRQSI